MLMHALWEHSAQIEEAVASPEGHGELLRETEA